MTRSASDPGEPAEACEALRTVGLDEIMERALRKGLVERVATTSSEPPALVPGRLYAQVGLVMGGFQWTARAIQMGVPQRAGAAVVAGCTAAIVAVWHLVRRGPSEAERASAEAAAREAAAPRAGPFRPAPEGPSPVPQSTGSGWRPPRSDCQGNLNRCLETILGKRHSSGTAGESICAACFWQCRNDDNHDWLDWLDNGKDCRWWEYHPFQRQ